MIADPPVEEILRALSESTERLCRAAASGDSRLARALLEERGTGVQRLLQRTGDALSDPQLAELERIIARGDEAARGLRARRETARALIAEIEAVRRRLAGWMPNSSGAASRVDLTG